MNYSFSQMHEIFNIHTPFYQCCHLHLSSSHCLSGGFGRADASSFWLTVVLWLSVDCYQVVRSLEPPPSDLMCYKIHRRMFTPWVCLKLSIWRQNPKMHKHHKYDENPDKRLLLCSQHTLMHTLVFPLQSIKCSDTVKQAWSSIKLSTA